MPGSPKTVRLTLRPGREGWLNSLLSCGVCAGALSTPKQGCSRPNGRGRGSDVPTSRSLSADALSRVLCRCSSVVDGA
jgi:hypothetical protein